MAGAEGMVRTFLNLPSLHNHIIAVRPRNFRFFPNLTLLKRSRTVAGRNVSEDRRAGAMIGLINSGHCAEILQRGSDVLKCNEHSSTVGPISRPRRLPQEYPGFTRGACPTIILARQAP